MGQVIDFDLNRFLLVIACFVAGLATLILTLRMWNQRDRICDKDDADCQNYNQGLVTFGSIVGLTAAVLGFMKIYYKFNRPTDSTT